MVILGYLLVLHMTRVFRPIPGIIRDAAFSDNTNIRNELREDNKTIKIKNVY